MQEPRLWSLLLFYAFCSFTYSLLCGLLGRAYHPLSAFQVYAIAIPFWYFLLLILHRLTSPSQSIRMWPPTKKEVLSGVAATIILTSETLALLSPSSIVAIVAGKGGCLAFPDPLDRRPWYKKMRLAFVAFTATLLASLQKPWHALALPLILACFYVVGQRLKLRSVRLAKGDPAASSGFFGAGQIVVISTTLTLALLFHQFKPAADFGDLRLWFIALGSLGCGLLGLRLVLHRTPEGVVFPAYRAASLFCALGASAARGEALHWSGWAAVALAAGVVLWASAEGFLRRCGRWLKITWWLAMSELGGARRALAS